MEALALSMQWKLKKIFFASYFADRNGLQTKKVGDLLNWKENSENYGDNKNKYWWIFL